LIAHDAEAPGHTSYSGKSFTSLKDVGHALALGE
jgi:hypothetical protein